MTELVGVGWMAMVVLKGFGAGSVPSHLIFQSSIYATFLFLYFSKSSTVSKWMPLLLYPG